MSAQCGAKTRSGSPCKRPPVPGRKRCKLHGGNTPVAGPTHPTYKHGRYSKALNGTPLDELYQTARTDPKLLALREDIALLTSMQQQTIAGLQTGESGEAWAKIANDVGFLLMQLPQLGLKDKHLEYLHERLTAVHETATGALGDKKARQEYEERAETIRKLVDTERKYEEGLRLYLPLDRANAIMGRWLDAIRRVVPQEYIKLLLAELRAGGVEMPSLGRDLNTLPRSNDDD